jgi:hypothetical protein
MLLPLLLLYFHIFHCHYYCHYFIIILRHSFHYFAMHCRLFIILPAFISMFSLLSPFIITLSPFFILCRYYYCHYFHYFIIILMPFRFLILLIIFFRLFHYSYATLSFSLLSFHYYLPLRWYFIFSHCYFSLPFLAISYADILMPLLRHDAIISLPCFSPLFTPSLRCYFLSRCLLMPHIIFIIFIDVSLPLFHWWY